MCYMLMVCIILNGNVFVNASGTLKFIYFIDAKYFRKKKYL